MDTRVFPTEAVTGRGKPLAVEDATILSVTVQLPVSLSLIKHWGYRCETLLLPLTGSRALSLDASEVMHITATACASPHFARNRLWVDGKETGAATRPFASALAQLRELAATAEMKAVASWPLHLAVATTIPARHTAFDLASQADVAVVCAVAKLYNVIDSLPKAVLAIARSVGGRGVTCLTGGFVAWNRGFRPDGLDSVTTQNEGEHHWNELCGVALMGLSACDQDTTLKLQGNEASLLTRMQRTAGTSMLHQARVDLVTPTRLAAFDAAVDQKDFAALGNLVMAESNTLQACLADAVPPVAGVSDVSRRLMDVVHRFNAHMGRTAAAYSFEAGPDPVLLFLERDAGELFQRLLYHFPPAKTALDAFSVDDYFYGSTAMASHFVSGWMDVAELRAPPEVYAAVYARVKEATRVHAQADDAQLEQAMRWCGKVTGAVPFRVGPGWRLPRDVRHALLNSRTGLPTGWGSASTARETATATATAATVPLPLPQYSHRRPDLDLTAETPWQPDATQQDTLTALQVRSATQPPASLAAMQTARPTAHTQDRATRYAEPPAKTDGGGLQVSELSASVNAADIARMQAGVRAGLQQAENFQHAMTQQTPAASTWQAMTRASLGNGVSGGSSNSNSNAGDYAPNSLMAIMLKDPALSTFAELVKKAQLDFDLGSADSNFTVFCPTSTAISTKLASEGRTITDLYSSPHLVQIVKDHVVVGMAELTDGRYLQTWGGAHFMVRRQRGLNKIADAPIQALHMLALNGAKPCNGVVHAVGQMLGTFTVC